jgi:hemolysin III
LKPEGGGPHSNSMHPNYTRRELIADAWVHAVGVTAALVAIGALLVTSGSKLSPLALASVVVYGVTLVAMLVFSACYNLIPVAAWKDRLRRCDQAAIFLKIAGTYTPFALAKMGGVWGYTLLALVWLIALLGGGAKVLLGAGSPKLSVALSLALGWVGVLFLQPLIAAIPSESLLLLGFGGLAYTCGVVFHVWDELPYQNVIWHVFVLSGTALHFAAVTYAMT